MHLRYVAFVYLAVFAVVAGTVTCSAFAENPEILPNPTTKEPLTFTGEGAALKWETVGGPTYKCVKTDFNGAFSAARIGQITISGVGCKESKTGAACNTKGDSKEVILLTGAAHVVTLKAGTSLGLGIVLTLPEAIPYKCSLVTEEVKGAVIGQITGVVSGVKTKTATLSYKETKGMQEFTKCQEDVAFCEGKTFRLEAKIGEDFEVLGWELEAKLTFDKEAAVDF